MLQLLLINVEPCRFCSNIPHVSGVPCSACGFPGLRRGNFRESGFDKETRSSVQVCQDCKDEGRDGRCVELSAGSTGRDSTWGAGVPCHVRICTTCGRYDGPWVKSDHVGGCW